MLFSSAQLPMEVKKFSEKVPEKKQHFHTISYMKYNIYTQIHSM